MSTLDEDVYNVNMPYHHGNLREALIEAGLATARAEGPEAVVLRAATRAAGVSPNAAYRHFADRDELLGAVARRCMEKLAELIESRLAETRAHRDTARRGGCGGTVTPRLTRGGLERPHDCGACLHRVRPHRDGLVQDGLRLTCARPRSGFAGLEDSVRDPEQAPQRSRHSRSAPD